jgi:cytochrome c
MMRHLLLYLLPLAMLFALGCSNRSNNPTTDQKPAFSLQRAAQKDSPERVAKDDPASTRVALDQLGSGPIESVELNTLDPQWAEQGRQMFEQKCHACHRADRKFIGPSLAGVLQRRNPVWVMNMILNPDQMVQKDPLAQELFMEFNGSPMTNLNLTEDQARTILEYFRTL